MTYDYLPHPLLVENFRERVKQSKMRGNKVLVDMKIADVPHMNSMICETLAEFGVDAVTILKEVGDLDKVDTHGLELVIVSVNDLTDEWKEQPHD